MSDTTKSKLLLIAPDLAPKINNIAKNILISISNIEDSTSYVININSVDYIIESGIGATALSIASDLVTELGTSEIISASDNANGTLNCVAVEAGVDFNVTVSDNLSYAVVNDNYNGQELFDTILSDVIDEVTEEQYDDEEERAQRYLLAHLLSVTNTSNNTNTIDPGFSSETVGDVSYKKAGYNGLSMNERFLSSTVYGTVFYSIYLRHYFRFL